MHHISIAFENENIPIGRCLPGRRVALVDIDGQQVIPDGHSVGEMFLGGVEMFPGYLDRLAEENARSRQD